MNRDNTQNDQHDFDDDLFSFHCQSQIIYFNLMDDYCERENSKTKGLKVNKIVDSKKTHSNLQNQLQVVRKVVCSMSWLNNEMLTDSIVYEISRFVFRNPICFTALVFRHVESTKLKVNSRKTYILVNSHL